VRCSSTAAPTTFTNIDFDDAIRIALQGLVRNSAAQAGVLWAKLLDPPPAIPLSRLSLPSLMFEDSGNASRIGGSDPGIRRESEPKFRDLRNRYLAVW
jgi:hypothetical protein